MFVLFWVWQGVAWPILIRLKKPSFYMYDNAVYPDLKIP